MRRSAPAPTQRVAEADAVLADSRKDLRRTDRHARRPHRAAHAAGTGRARRKATGSAPGRRDRRGRSRARAARGQRNRRPTWRRSPAPPKQAQAAVAEAEAAAVRAEAAHSARRQALDVAREPLAEAERRAQRLDTEAKTLAKLLHVDTKNLWPAVIDDLTVDKGYEAALGAALGDDLEAPVDPSAPMRWAGADDRARPIRRCRKASRRWANMSRRRRSWRAGWRRSAWSSARTGRAPRAAAQARPAAGLRGRRPVALGRLLGRRQCADRRGAPARRQEPPRRHRGRTGRRARRGRRESRPW